MIEDPAFTGLPEMVGIGDDASKVPVTILFEEPVYVPASGPLGIERLALINEMVP
jgi:hypothetical protein